MNHVEPSLSTQTSRSIQPGQIWADLLNPKRRPLEFVPGEAPRMGRPHFVVIIHDDKDAILAPACLHNGRWVQTLIGEGERLSVPLDELATLSCRRRYELVHPAPADLRRN